MEPLNSTADADWLLARVGSWATVGGVAGTGFEAYARILHPVQAWQDDPAADGNDHRWLDETRWPWAEVARRNQRAMHPLVQWRSLTDNEERLDFADGWHVGQSETGQLPADLLAALTVPLGHHTATPDDITAGVWNGWGDLHVDAGGLLLFFSDDVAPEERERERVKAEAAWREERRRSVSPAVQEMVEHGPFLAWPGRELMPFRTSLGELADPKWVTRAGLAGVMPQLLWPADHQWVVASEIDWDSTIVAGPRTLVDEILASDVWESFEVHETSDLTWDGDVINPRPPGRG
jgi:hypothetical protein